MNSQASGRNNRQMSVGGRLNSELSGRTVINQIIGTQHQNPISSLVRALANGSNFIDTNIQPDIARERSRGRVG